MKHILIKSTAVTLLAMIVSLFTQQGTAHKILKIFNKSYKFDLRKKYYVYFEHFLSNNWPFV